MYNEALAEFKRAISVNDDFEPAYTGMAFVYELMDRIPDAIEAYKKAIAANPHMIELQQHLAQLYIQQNALDDALVSLKRVVAADPRNYDALVKIGLIYAEQKKYEQALEAFQAVSHAVPKDLKIKRYLASTLVAAGIACSLLAFAGRWPFRRGTAVLAAGALMGLAFMAKGPASALVALTPLLFWLLFARPVPSAAGTTRAGSPHPQMMDGLGPGWAIGLALLVALLLAAWWYVVLWAQIGTARFAELVRFEMLGRLAGEMHRTPFYFYLYVLPLAAFPWSLALLSALAVAWRPLRGAWPNSGDTILFSGRPEKSDGVPRIRSRPSAESLRAVADPFLVAWVLAVLLFFSIPKAKLGSYMLPALPAAALLTARFLTRLRSAEEPLRRVWVSLPAVLAGAAAAALALVPFSAERLPQDAQEALAAAPLPPWAIAGILILFLCVPWIWSCAARDARPVAVAVSVFILAAVLFVLPVAAERLVYKSTSRDLARDPAVQARLANAERVYTSGWEEEGLAYYLHRPVHEIGAKEEKKEEPPRDAFAKAFASAPPGRVLIFAHKGKTLKWFTGQAPERRLLGARPFVEVARACGAELPKPLRVIAENRYVAVLVNEP
jgi:tetratricopeptide (TPR) repeat protein